MNQLRLSRILTWWSLAIVLALCSTWAMVYILASGTNGSGVALLLPNDNLHVGSNAENLPSLKLEQARLRHEPHQTYCFTETIRTEIGLAEARFM